ncbi:MAG: succinyldiaminopimelate transaminase [Gammaproteobacteria bacterium]|nr:succinyldiaminopimelate transaminase [Gammaproteobacteria bacterium]MBQ0839017.1 succinyldiaminopimelate transaminase [Gammaproteobacteria bacterium]
MNPDLQSLQPYPFEKLKALLATTQAPSAMEAISLSVGEPKHGAPQLVIDTLIKHTAGIEQSSGLSAYPGTKGIVELRETIAQWLAQRFNLSTMPDPEQQILPVNGTREALFAFAQAVIDPANKPTVVMPNPFYQIYEGAALLAGAQPVFLNCTEDTDFAPDFSSLSAADWQRCQLVYICTPGNPTGSVLSLDTLKELIALADRHDFVIASDECYSEIYADESQPPPGLLQACAELGRDDFKRCMVFHSLSKRSNLPGLRSGFVAGDADIIQQFLLYRTYHGCAMPLQHQWASVTAWGDEAHVFDNRRQYREKFSAVTEILKPVMAFSQPDAGFYLWPQTPIADDVFTRELLATQNVAVVPGRYLARDTTRGNPGEQRIRLALVAPLAQCEEAAQRIKHYIETL